MCVCVCVCVCACACACVWHMFTYIIKFYHILVYLKSQKVLITVARSCTFAFNEIENDTAIGT